MSIYRYIYIYRERERCIYTHICIHVYHLPRLPLSLGHLASLRRPHEKDRGGVPLICRPREEDWPWVKSQRSWI